MNDPFPIKHICHCPCHNKGSRVLHVVACCRVCYAHYINVDGSIDIEAYGKAVRSGQQYKKPKN